MNLSTILFVLIIKPRGKLRSFTEDVVDPRYSK